MIIAPKPFKVAKKTFINSKNYAFDKDLIFYERGSHGIISGIRMVSKDVKNILIPALFCKETKDSLQQAGFTIHYLDINDNFSWDMDSLIKYTSNNSIEAVIICDFFGAKNINLDEIINFCKDNNLISIRDCCHSPFSFDKYDIKSDITVFSFRKVFAIQDGGALVLKSKKQLINETTKVFKINKIKSFIDWLLSINYKFNVLNPFLVIDFFDKNHVNTRYIKKNIDIKSTMPSKSLINNLNNQTLLNYIKMQRKKNTKLIIDFFNKNKDLKLTPIHFDKESSLQTLPVLSENPSELINFLRKKGIGALSWPGKSMPEEVLKNKSKYPTSIRINNSLICLPIHQDVGEEHLNYMKLTILEFNNENIK